MINVHLVRKKSRIEHRSSNISHPSEKVAHAQPSVSHEEEEIQMTKIDPRGKISLFVGYSTQHAGDVY